MRRLLKLWLMCVVVLAVSVQGVAAAAMLNCGPIHHPAPADIHGGHDHSVHSNGHLNHSPESAKDAGTAIAAADETDAAEGTQLTQQAPKAKCSACASCCSAAALPSGIADFEEKSNAEPYVIPAGSRAAAFLTNGPERPPRHSLA
jgi:hypothetical protein